MNLQGKSFIFSAAIHLLALLFILFINAGSHIRQTPVVIDFSTTEPERSGTVDKNAPIINNKGGLASRSRPVKLSQTVQTSIEKGPQNIHMGAVDAQTPVDASVPHASSPGATTASTGLHGGAGTGTGNPYGPAGNGTDQIGFAERAKKGYLKQHFTAIRENIMKMISYPIVARRMGWTGTVKISFVVCEDGSARDIKVLHGSGFEMLDRNAVETIRKCSPYPKPPVMAEIIMPITYRLD